MQEKKNMFQNRGTDLPRQDFLRFGARSHHRRQSLDTLTMIPTAIPETNAFSPFEASHTETAIEGKREKPIGRAIVFAVAWHHGWGLCCPPQFRSERRYATRSRSSGALIVRSSPWGMSETGLGTIVSISSRAMCTSARSAVRRERSLAVSR